MEASKRRLSMSLSAIEVLWLQALLAMLRRGADCRVLMRAQSSAGVTRKIEAAASKASRELNPRKRARTHCPNGHEYTVDNLFSAETPNGRRCRVCRREALRRHYVNRRARAENAKDTADERRTA